MKIENYNFVFLTIGKYIIISYAFYMLFVIVNNLFLKETNGEIIFIKNYQEHIVRAPTKFENSGGKGYIEYDVWRKDIYYTYRVNNTDLSNSTISNILIYPNKEYTTGQKVIVYYNIIFPKYSILFKCNTTYFVANIIPLSICIVIYIFLCYYNKNKKHYTNKKLRKRRK